MIATLRQPGPEQHPRWIAQTCTATPVAVTLPVGPSLLSSVAHALADYDGAWLWIENAPMARLDFLIPGLDSTGAHAAWYAGPHRMPAGARIIRLGLHLGWRQGARFLHGHGVFAAPGWGGPQAGHILLLESTLATPVRATGWGLRGAQLVQQSDPETGFPLFAAESTGGGRGALLLTVRPNQDLGTAVAAAAAAHEIAQGTVHGLGSIVRPRFDDGTGLDSPATEILLTDGQFRDGFAQLTVDAVGVDGRLASGSLVPGANGICITAELLICT